VTGFQDTDQDNGIDAIIGLSCVKDNSETDGITGPDRVVALSGVGFVESHP